MLYARLIQGTLRSQSRCNESTRGIVSCSEVLNFPDFSATLRIASAPDDAPAPAVLTNVSATVRSGPWPTIAAKRHYAAREADQPRGKDEVADRNSSGFVL